jgi:AcrR family transcriptional regulator
MGEPALLPSRQGPRAPSPRTGFPGTYAVNSEAEELEIAQPDAAQKTRLPLTRDRVLRAAAELADARGIESLTMRNLGQELGVEAMSLYNHVANKEAVLDGVAEVVIGEVLAAVDEIEPAASPAEWKAVTRRRILAAREVLLRHRWAPAVLESRTTMPPPALQYFDSLLGAMREGGFSLDLAHHAMHALGSRALGFTQELFVTEDDDLTPEEAAVMFRQMGAYPHLVELMGVVYHDADSTLGGCDDQFEFEFGLDLILDGLERLRDAAWQLPDRD